jgi:hypothetical protein
MCRSLLKIFRLKKLTAKKISLHCLFNSGIVVSVRAWGPQPMVPVPLGQIPQLFPAT